MPDANGEIPIEEHEKARRAHDERLSHIQAKLDALTNIVMRREGGPEGQGAP